MNAFEQPVFLYEQILFVLSALLVACIHHMVSERDQIHQCKRAVTPLGYLTGGRLYEPQWGIIGVLLFVVRYFGILISCGAFVLMNVGFAVGIDGYPDVLYSCLFGGLSYVLAFILSWAIKRVVVAGCGRLGGGPSLGQAIG